VTLPLQERK